MGKKYELKNGDISISRGRKHDYIIKYAGSVWKNEGRGSFVTFHRQMFGKFAPIIKRLTSAKKIQSAIINGEDYSAIETRYQGFSVLGKRDDCTLITTVKLFNDGRIVFAVDAENEGEKHLRSVHWPSAFNRSHSKKADNYSVVAYRQGAIIQDKNGATFADKFIMTTFKRDVNTGDCYMPLWGRVCGDCGYSAFIEDANDSAVFNSFGKGLCILAAPYYFSSLGKLGYARALQIRFSKNCDYNTFAKEYRSFLIKNNQFVTLSDKIKANPNVANLIGTPVIHTNIYRVTQPESAQYDPSNAEVFYASFAERAAHFTRFKQLGLQRAYIHLDGWGNQGYDNLHPYILPPCQKAGGAVGMKKLADTCQDLGYIFGVHDQYRDFYYRSPSYDSTKAVMNIDGSSKMIDTWLGGAHNWLCASQAPAFVERTYSELKELGINVAGSYLDVFSIVLGDECFNPDHMITRTESIAYRKQCFDLLRRQGLIVCSEEPGALMINSIDLVHHAPYKLAPQDGGCPYTTPQINTLESGEHVVAFPNKVIIKAGGRPLGTPIPFFNLVYHECVFTPWRVDDTGGWGIPAGERGEMHCILNAATPYFVGLNGDQMESFPGLRSDAEIVERIEKCNRICAIEQSLFDKEMLKHTFLSDDKKVQQCLYSDGTTITVDFKNNTYQVISGK